MRAREILLGAILVTTALAGCFSDASADLAENPVAPCGQLETSFDVEAAQAYDPRVRFETSNGTVTLVVFLEQAPVTAGNFLDLVRQDTYDGTRFHLLRPGVFVQGGDPRSANEDRRLWGTGGPGYTIPDEFHQFLRYDQAGTVGMAVSQPNSGGSQFVISLRPLPGLTDHSAVFGRVTSGLSTVEEISRTPTDSQNRPRFHAKLHEATILPPERNPSNATVELSSYGFDCEQAAEPGGTAEFLIAARNTGYRVMNGTFEAQTPAGNWSVDIRNTQTIALPSGQTVSYILDVDVPDDAEPGAHTLNVTFADRESDAATTRELTVNVGALGASPKRGETATLRYVGVLEDGRPFDTTIPVYPEATSLTWFKSSPEHLEPLRITLGESPLITGMTKLANRAKVGQSVVGAVSPNEGYGTNQWGDNDLGGRLLIFQLELLPGDVKATRPATEPPGDAEGR